MNLYTYHNTPEQLKWAETIEPIVKQSIIDKFWSGYGLPEYKGEGEDFIAKHADFSFFYATEVLEKRFPEGEDAIATDGRYSYNYAVRILEDRFPKGEEAIMKSEYATWYKKQFIDK